MRQQCTRLSCTVGKNGNCDPGPCGLLDVIAWSRKRTAETLRSQKKSDDDMWWYPFLEEFRTLCVAPTADVRTLFDDLHASAHIRA